MPRFFVLQYIEEIFFFYIFTISYKSDIITIKYCIILAYAEIYIYCN